MNIRGLSQIIALPLLDRKKESRSTDADKDPNGRQDPSQGEQTKRKLTEEELLQAIENLKQNKGVLDNHLQVRLVEHDGVKNVFVEDISGKVIRRIPESQLSSLLVSPAQSKGQLLNRKL
ncbi:MAG: hypothetical protein COT74_03780 [Bdellovibrionales bacterium CG10_big_fil_rev_8_21_14_0_10_45_34]|nr:MAG: hypothetical protein COT74_03780 [Bdellovibrionales bacterium CG10_big_fil_rev_8_21_14_0_10_45_34]